jgi:hypothetical protein
VKGRGDNQILQDMCSQYSSTYTSIGSVGFLAERGLRMAGEVTVIGVIIQYHSNGDCFMVNAETEARLCD